MEEEIYNSIYNIYNNEEIKEFDINDLILKEDINYNKIEGDIKNLGKKRKKLH